MYNSLPIKLVEKLSPVWKVENGCIISKFGDITVGFRVELPEIFTLTADEYAALHGVWVKAIATLPKFSVVHKQDWFVREIYAPGVREKSEPSFFDKAFERHFCERPFLHHACYLFISKSSPVNMRKQTLGNALSRSRVVPLAQLDEQEVDRFMDSVALFTSIMGAVDSIKIWRLSEADIIGTEARAGLIDRYYSLSLSDEVASLPDIQLNPESVVVGDKMLCATSLADVEHVPMSVSSDKAFTPLSTDRSSCRLGFAAPVGLMLSCNHIYNQYIFVGDWDAEIRRMETRSKRMRSFSQLSRANATNYESLDKFLKSAASEDRRVYRAHFNVLAWSDTRSEAELKKVKYEVGAAFSTMGCRARDNAIDAPALFWAGVPGGVDFPSEDAFPVFLEPAVCFFNAESCFRTSLSPFGVRLADRFSGRPLHLDISDEPMKRGMIANRNKFILGGSGSGKSFFTNHLVRSYYEQGTHVVLVDVGHSYLGLCQIINQRTLGKDGIYFTYTEDNPISFNPFYTEDGKYDIEKKDSLQSLILTLWKKKNEEPKRSEEISVTSAIDLYLKKIQGDKTVVPSFNTFYEFLRDEFKADLERKRTNPDYFDVDNMLYVLRPFYRGGTYDYLLNSTKQLDLLSKRFVVFELDNIKDNKILFPVVTIIIMESFISKMRKLKGIRKMLVIEEAWKAIAHEGMAEYIKYMFKTVRKYFGEAVVVTQEIEDILSSPIVKETIVKNSDTKILLDLRKFLNSFDGIQGLLGLTDKQKAQVLSLNENNDPRRSYREVYIDLGGKYSNVYATELSREEYYTYTTEEKEKKLVFDTAAKYGGDIEHAINEIVSRE